jgi:hypothetical protein
MVPEFESGLKMKAPSEQSEHPLDQKYLRLNAIVFHFLVDSRLVVFE